MHPAEFIKQLEKHCGNNAVQHFRAAQNQYYNNYPTAAEHDLEKAMKTEKAELFLMSAFPWSCTVEGPDFWQECCTRLKDAREGGGSIEEDSEHSGLDNWNFTEISARPQAAAEKESNNLFNV